MKKTYNFTRYQTFEFPRLNTQYQTFLALSDKKKPIYLQRLEEPRQELIRDRWRLDEIQCKRELPEIQDKAELYRMELVDKTRTLPYGPLKS